MKELVSTYRIKITGLVQGIGFRPFIYRLASDFNATGTVDNRNDGVLIYINLSDGKIKEFVKTIFKKAPEASVIENITEEKIKFQKFRDFRIIKSKNNKIGDDITEISPDIAVCSSCLTDMKSQPHRIDYPFINCTNCGPRFTIIRSLPYDRPNTTMADFTMCGKCESEYSDVGDRRFHAQPVACNNCGPHYTLYHRGEKINGIGKITEIISGELENDSVVAVKGMGGFNLICNGLSKTATLKLRQSKHRDGKPLALMFRDIESVKKYAVVSEEEENMLNSWRRPIVILKTKTFPNLEVTSGFKTLGAMLPYMPFHYLLFEKINCDALVYTSANLSGEPIIKDNLIALKAWENNLPVLVYNREIHNRTDDSVGFVAGGSQRIIRRSRGYAPSPVRMPFSVDGIIAAGAELVNCFCIGRTSQAIVSQHIGDLKNAETLEFYEESIERFKQLYKFEPHTVACDLHPDYLSTRFAGSLGLPLVKVQHHHAHMAAVMAENNLDENVIGVVMDGTGYGTDGNIWGGEFFTGDFKGFKRHYHFEYVPVPGGDAAVKHPWRTALSYLYQCYGKETLNIEIPFVESLDREKSELIIQLIDKKLNSPLSSSAGRLFDAVSALLQLCSESQFHAEAPMRLEDAIDTVTGEFYNFDVVNNIISFKKTIKGIVNDIKNGVSTGLIAAKFHNTIVEVSANVCISIRDKTTLNKVVMSGGSFQNRYLSENLEKRLTGHGFEIYYHRKVPANDGGLALGQLAIAKYSILENFNN